MRGVFGRINKSWAKPRQRSHWSPFGERFEDRCLLTVFTVVNLADQGAGSLRQAILDANSTAGEDTIRFDVDGVINLKSALPKITDTLHIDGYSAPDYCDAPVVGINFNSKAGLRLEAGSDGSSIKGLSLYNSSSTAITVNGVGHIAISGNYIGLQLDGVTAGANRGYGIEIINSISNTIGGDEGNGNVISANRDSGILLKNTSATWIDGNLIGTDVTGLLDRGNGKNGIWLTGKSSVNVIGGKAGNVISGNGLNGIYLDGKSYANIISGNIVGLAANRKSALGNDGDGVKLKDADSNLIGRIDPVQGVTYFDTEHVSMQPVSAWQGIRGTDNDGQYLIVGTSDDNGLLFHGTIDGVGLSYAVNYPDALTTSVYGPNDLKNGFVQLVGSYKNSDYETAEVEVNGFIFEGAITDLANAANYRTINYPGAKYNYVHSVMGGLAVGNYDSPLDHGSYDLEIGPGHAFLYDVENDVFLTDIVYPGSLSNTAYGIWHNGEGKYTIVGGYSLSATHNLTNPETPIGKAYIVDYDAATGKFSNWTTFEYPEGVNVVTHFEGISSVEKGTYTLNADSLEVGSGNPSQGSWVSVRRNADGTFGKATWVDLNVTGYDPTTNISSSNSVYGYQVVGVVIGESDTSSFQATIDVGFTTSNVISGNKGNGISLYNSDNNQISMNLIGTDGKGYHDLGNSLNGILITSGSANNMIGGQATGGNDPTNNVFARPPQGNLISGNDQNGVLISSKATQNTLSGNYIGTTADGNHALGNTLDGVAIVNAHGNQLIGCLENQDPFVFYNVVSGNGGNGLRVSNSNDTIIQANFFGLGADNNTPVGNALDGVQIEGSSTRTTFGGPIPLGNVVAANGENGLEVRDKVKDFIAYNTFAGLAAFTLNTTLGNGRDGMLITSTGGGIEIRTNVVSNNGDDGIEVSGKAKGVRINGNIIGMNTDGTSAMGNSDNGIEVGGSARDVIIGSTSYTFNIIPQNVISANGNNGIEVKNSAREVTINASYIGVNIFGYDNFGNGHNGVFISDGTSQVTIGTTDPNLLTVISGNTAHGIEMHSTQKNTVVGTLIGTAANGRSQIGNGGNGILIGNSSKNTIGRISATSNGTVGGASNIIAYNALNGIEVRSGSENALYENSIHSNGGLGIDIGIDANNNQNAPVLASTALHPLGLEIVGTLNSKANSKFTLEFFASNLDGSNGKVYLGSQQVKTDAKGNVEFTFYGPIPELKNYYITSTATDSKGNTSEFSNAVDLPVG
ncbi:beta strand repeat-containing protein [Planctomicrobium sp. SH664]|uniref:beta strand repeat-containing protein n=1 Tax=Planctomicrobium sp. SH664 TaxID=3448125 RepID=UPI003F5B6690